MATIPCPHCHKPVEVAGPTLGKTAMLKEAARKWFAANPGKSVDACFKALQATYPDANVNTLLTQVRAAR